MKLAIQIFLNVILFTTITFAAGLGANEARFWVILFGMALIFVNGVLMGLMSE